MEKACKGTEWLKLTILNVDHGAGEDEAFITFRMSFQNQAYVKSGIRDIKHKVKRAQVVSERARFVRLDGRWLCRVSTPLSSNKL